MTIQQLKDSGWIILEAVVGSHLYGTNKEGSDVDIKGVYIQPTEDILSGNYIEQISDDKQDTTYYEIGRFLDLLMKANPNMLDILGSHLINHKDERYDRYFRDPSVYITSKIKHTFFGYSYAQIQKAKGMNKKTNWEKNRVERKNVLDFCYVLIENEKSILFKKWSKKSKLNNENLGLAKVNNFPDLYSVYFVPDKKGGIADEKSNDVQLRNINKKLPFITYLRFDRNAYSTHCKDYREYEQWLKERNPLRYNDNAKVNNQYDTKNMMHCIRLLNTCKDLLLGKGLQLRRPNDETKFLLDIRNGEILYDYIIELAESLQEEINTLYETTTLPKEVSLKHYRNLLLQIRLENFKNFSINSLN